MTSRQERRRRHRINVDHDLQHREHEVRTMLGKLMGEAKRNGTPEEVEMHTRHKQITNMILTKFRNGTLQIAEAIILSRLQILLFAGTNKVTLLMQGPSGDDGDWRKDLEAGIMPKLSCIVCDGEPFTSSSYLDKLNDPTKRAYTYVVCRDHFLGYLEKDSEEEQEIAALIEGRIEVARQIRRSQGVDE